MNYNVAVEHTKDKTTKKEAGGNEHYRMLQRFPSDDKFLLSSADSRVRPNRKEDVSEVNSH